jgi:hypothetical protein
MHGVWHGARVVQTVGRRVDHDSLDFLSGGYPSRRNARAAASTKLALKLISGRAKRLGSLVWRGATVRQMFLIRSLYRRSLPA